MKGYKLLPVSVPVIPVLVVLAFDAYLSTLYLLKFFENTVDFPFQAFALLPGRSLPLLRGGTVILEHGEESLSGLLRKGSCDFVNEGPQTV